MVPLAWLPTFFWELPERMLYMYHVEYSKYMNLINSACGSIYTFIFIVCDDFCLVREPSFILL